MEELDIENIAKTCHEVNRAYCEGFGDTSQTVWEMAPKSTKESVRDGVKFLIENPQVSATELHDNWLDFKLDDGWTFGTEKDVNKKTHPCLVPYSRLPRYQRTKDKLFSSIVKTFVFGR